MGRQQVTIVGALWSVVPFTFFITSLLNIYLMYHDFRTSCLVVLVSLFMASLSPLFSPLAFPFCWQGWIVKEPMRGFSIMLFMATLSGAIIGLGNYEHNVGPSLEFSDKQWYHNVLPTEPAAGVADAIALTFAAGTHVSTFQSAGYKAMENGGTVYCAAPIFNDQNAESGKSDYWAVGVDCCNAKSVFWCDGVADPEAKDAIVLTEQPYLFLSPRRANRDAFLKAINMIRAEYKLPVSDPMLLRWVRDAESTRHDWAARGSSVFTMALLISMVMSAFIGLSAAALTPAEAKRPRAPLSEWRDADVKLI